jgi:23S rRNA (uracil1939-C5)-methyltransferase
MEVDIHDISSKGLGVGRKDKKVLFVKGALPHERVSVTPTRIGSSVLEAELDAILKESPERVIPRCPHFGKCGGCQLQHLSYEGQLKTKQKRVQDALERIADIKDVTVAAVKPSVEFAYRNKVQLPVRGGKLGFFAANSQDFVPIDHCHLHLKSSQTVLEEISLMDIPKELDTLVMKTAFSTESILIIFSSYSPLSTSLIDFAKKIVAEKKRVKGIYFTQRQQDSNYVFGKKFTLLAGEELIEDNLLGLKFAIYKDAFYQVNPFQVPLLYQHVMDLLDLTSRDRVLDAFCGVGTMTLLAAKSCQEAIGIECVASSIESAKKNCALNLIQNAQFYLAKAEEKIKELGYFDKVILNPPRKGCESSVLEALKNQRVKKIVYVSCDPATFARDCKILKSHYKLKSVQPFDLFPQTVHVETVGCLELI